MPPGSAAWRLAGTLDELKDVPVRVSDVAAGDTVPGTAGVVQQHRAVRYLPPLRALDAFERRLNVIHPQRDVGAARVAAPGLDGLPRRADVLDQLDDPTVATVHVRYIQLDRVRTDERCDIRPRFGHPAEQAQAQPATPERQGTIEVGDREPDMIDAAHHAVPLAGAPARSRAGTRSRPRTSSIVSRRLTTSAVGP